jgi:hypothetical protein
LAFSSEIKVQMLYIFAWFKKCCQLLSKFTFACNKSLTNALGGRLRTSLDSHTVQSFRTVFRTATLESYYGKRLWTAWTETLGNIHEESLRIATSGSLFGLIF